MKTYIIAEAGVNHNGSIKNAKKLVDLAKRVGASAVKFQSFKPEEVIAKGTPMCDYQSENAGGSHDQFELLDKLTLSSEETRELFKYGEEKGIEVLSTAFDERSLEILNDLKMPIFKVASGEITNYPLILKFAQSKKPIILSTGMSNLKDIKNALSVIAYGYLSKETQGVPTWNEFEKAYESSEGKKVLKSNVTILHCTSNYPAKPCELNLNAMLTIQKEFGLKVGYSDHSLGVDASVAAVAMGATLIEKHFTLDKDMPGPDHKASLEEEELKTLIEKIALVEEMKGNSQKTPTKSELETLKLVRRSLVAGEDIKEGEKFTIHNLKVKRPGTGVSPSKYWEYLNRVAKKDYKRDELI